MLLTVHEIHNQNLFQIQEFMQEETLTLTYYKHSQHLSLRVCWGGHWSIMWENCGKCHSCWTFLWHLRCVLPFIIIYTLNSWSLYRNITIYFLYHWWVRRRRKHDNICLLYQIHGYCMNLYFTIIFFLVNILGTQV